MSDIVLYTLLPYYRRNLGQLEVLRGKRVVPLTHLAGWSGPATVSESATANPWVLDVGHFFGLRAGDKVRWSVLTDRREPLFVTPWATLARGGTWISVDIAGRRASWGYGTGASAAPRVRPGMLGIGNYEEVNAEVW